MWTLPAVCLAKKRNPPAVKTGGWVYKAAPETVTLSLKVPAAMKRALEKEAKAEGKSTGAYARGILADGLMAIA